MKNKYCAILTARGGSKSPLKKNIRLVHGKPLMSYALIEANKSIYIKKTYVSTDSKEIAKIGEDYGAEIIWRPEELCRDDSPHIDAIMHGYKYLKDKRENTEIIVLLQGNAPIFKPGIIDKGFEVILNDGEIDSCVSMSEFNHFNPSRAMKIVDGFLSGAAKIENLDFRDSTRNVMGDIYFYDGSVYIFRARCLNPNYGGILHPWMGHKIYPLIQEYGLDVDDMFGLYAVEYGLKRYGQI